ncbi:MAG: DUF438 domain-containing protein [Candidatus Eisenbacteria bacterium]|nr:DUF438 domain-containing protein [Candidatus Eisenbacteria bacterium]
MSELINNREKRIETLKEIIRSLHEGADPESVKGRLKNIVRQTTGSEIVEMESRLIADGMSPDEVKGMCDLHSAVLRELMGEQAAPSTPPGHPIDTFVRENQAIRKATGRLREMLREAEDPSPLKGAGPSIADWRLAARDLFDIVKHYDRKENLLFSHLEKHGITGPSKVMWAKDDDVRKMIRALNDALAEEGLTPDEWRKSARDFVLPTAAAIEEMIFKEENILFPTSLEALTAEEWGEIYRDTPRYGYCLIEPGTEYRPPRAELAAYAGTLPPGGAVVFPSGALTEEQMLALFTVFPVDVTFVDAEDRVAFFSEGPDRVFARTRSIIGRKVQNCHPPSSVHIVERILSDFRSGAESLAEFWIQLHGKFVHIRYFAVRDPEGKYLGTLEVTQDATRIRSLEGERRLLEYENA